MTKEYKQNEASEDVVTLLTHIRTRYEDKNKIHKERADIMEAQDEVLKYLLYINKGNSYSPKSYGELPRENYVSMLPVMGMNYMQSVKLFPDFVDFTPERTNVSEENETATRDLTDLHSLIRNEGKWKTVTLEAQRDLIRGEAFIYHDIVSKQGEDELNKIEYQHLPWETVRPNYDSSDWITAVDLTKNKYIDLYGEESFKLAGYGSTLDNNNNNYPDLIDDVGKLIQVMRYIDPATKTFVEIHGNSHVYQDLRGDKYPWMEEGETSVPILRYVCYEPVIGHHGWGILDFLVSLARTDTTITNASIQRSILKADPMRLITTDDPAAMEKQYRQYLANRTTGMSEPFFMKNSNIGTQAQVQNLDAGADNSNQQFWFDWVIQMATMETQIDFNQMVDYAPTADQQRLRKQEQDRINRVIIERNAERYKLFSLQDISMLRNRECKFNDIKLFLPATQEEIDASTPEMLDKNGKYPPREITVRQVVKSVLDLRIDIQPRLEGALDDLSFMEIQNMKQDIAMFVPNTIGYEKFMEYYMKKVYPRLNYEMGDNSKPFQQEQPEQPLPEPDANSQEVLPQLNQNLENAKQPI